MFNFVSDTLAEGFTTISAIRNTLERYGFVCGYLFPSFKDSMYPNNQMQLTCTFHTITISDPVPDLHRVDDARREIENAGFKLLDHHIRLNAASKVPVQIGFQITLDGDISKLNSGTNARQD